MTEREKKDMTGRMDRLMFEMARGGGPAFPVVVDVDDTKCVIAAGMSLRAYFAGNALVGMLAYSHVNPMRGNYHENCSIEGAAGDAVKYADALISELEKPK